MPTINATLGQIRASIESGAMKELAGKQLPVKTAYWLGRTIEDAQKRFAEMEKVRIDLVHKYGEQNGEQWQIKEENMAAFMAEFAELASEAVELPGRKLTLDELENVNISAEHLLNLGWLIGEEEAATVTPMRKKKAKAA